MSPSSAAARAFPLAVATPTVDLVCLGYNPWSSMWKRVQQIVWGLSQEPWIGRVLFINPSAWSAGLVLQPRLLWSWAGRNLLRAVVPRRASPKIQVLTPLHLPLAGSVQRLQAAEVGLTLSLIHRRIAKPYILLVNTPADPYDPIVVDLWQNADLHVFDWSDDFSTFADGPDEWARVESVCEHYVRTCDVTLAVNDRLGARARRLRRSAQVLTNGTDVASFGRALTGEVEIPKKLRSLPHPMIGYLGYRVADRLDLELIDHLAGSRPDWSFVFVGPAVGEDPLAEIMQRRPNVHVFGPVDYFELPRFVAAFDACMLPHKINAHTAGNDPIKIYDYLAAGRPVVATSVAGSEHFGGMVRIADTGESFLRALEIAVATDTPRQRARRVEAVEPHSWKAKTRVVCDLMRRALAAKWGGEVRTAERAG